MNETTSIRIYMHINNILTSSLFVRAKVPTAKVAQSRDDILFAVQSMVNLGRDNLDWRIFGDHSGDALGAAQQVQEQDPFFGNAMFYQRLDRFDGWPTRCYYFAWKKHEFSNGRQKH